MRVVVLFLLGTAGVLQGEVPALDGDRMLREFWERETREVESREAKSDLEKDRAVLQSMLGLEPFPERTPLKPVSTGKIDSVEGITVERLHFQALPGLYVTGNFYRPSELSEGDKFPAVLYVCGHSRQEKGGLSFGNKAGYQHHGIWYARNGFVCLMIDTIQLGEFKGIHHGTYRHERWWWNARGYTPAGTEAWCGIRALDYLQSRPEVDGERIGVAGRSGGGAYSWWIAALDERVKAAVPVAGVTSMRNHVVDDCVEGHCDCMFMVNAAGWDFDRVSSLVAPRPLLILNTDQDRIFPADGVAQVYQKTVRRYAELKKESLVSLRMTPGPHKDTEELQEAEYRFMLRHLRGEDPEKIVLAEKEIEPAELRVFGDLPKDEIVTSIDERLVPKAAAPKVPETETDWNAWRDETMESLGKESFRLDYGSEQGKAAKLGDSLSTKGVSLERYRVQVPGRPQQNDLFLLRREGLDLKDVELVVLNVLDESGWEDFQASSLAGFPLAHLAGGRKLDEEAFDSSAKMFAGTKWAMAYLCPRGIGTGAWSGDKKELTHIRRRFALLGTSQDAARVADIRAGIHALAGIEGWGNFSQKRLWLQAEGSMAGNALYAALLHGGKEPVIERLDLHGLPGSHERGGPVYLNVTRHLDLPEAVAMVAANSKVVLYTADPSPWIYPAGVAKKLGWSEKQIQVRDPLE